MTPKQCPDCQMGEHQRSDCPAHLPCPYWADHVHCYTMPRDDGPYFLSMAKVCLCGTAVSPHAFPYIPKSNPRPNRSASQRRQQ